MLQIMKQAALDALEASQPIAVMTGIVVSTEPLEITIDQRFMLNSESLVVPESLTRYEVELRHTHQYTDSTDTGSTTRNTAPALPEEPLILREGLQAGDKVILLRVQGGQQYIVLDKVVSR